LCIALALAAAGLAIHAPATLAALSEHVCAGPSPCFHTIQAAIDNAATNTVITVDAGTYLEHLSIPGNGSATTLTLWANPAATVDRGHKCCQPVLFVGSGEMVIVRNLAFVHGEAFQGSGIDNRGTLALQNSTVHDNTLAEEAGGIFNEGTLTLQGTTSVHDNQAFDDSGGIGNFGGSVLLEDTSAVYSNTVSSGCDVCASGVPVKPNLAPTGFGGGIENDGGTLTLEDS
jgi:hypothetical protein